MRNSGSKSAASSSSEYVIDSEPKVTARASGRASAVSSKMVGRVLGVFPCPGSASEPERPPASVRTLTRERRFDPYLALTYTIGFSASVERETFLRPTSSAHISAHLVTSS